MNAISTQLNVSSLIPPMWQDCDKYDVWDRRKDNPRTNNTWSNLSMQHIVFASVETYIGTMFAQIVYAPSYME